MSEELIVNVGGVDKIYPAFIKAYAEIPPIKMMGVNPFFKSKYILLDTILDVLRPILAKYGLAQTQHALKMKDSVYMQTIILHESGQSMEFYMEFPELVAEKNNSAVQILGKNITFMRRYALSSIWGISGEEDTDGNDAGQLARPIRKAEPKIDMKLVNEVKQALDIYQGDDKGDIEKMLSDKKQSREITNEFLNEVLEAIQ